MIYKTCKKAARARRTEARTWRRFELNGVHHEAVAVGGSPEKGWRNIRTACGRRYL